MNKLIILIIVFILSACAAVTLVHPTKDKLQKDAGGQENKPAKELNEKEEPKINQQTQRVY